MANIINRQQTFSTNGTVTAAGLHNLIDTALVNSAIIKNQQEITTIGTADLLLIAPDSVDASLAPRKVTVQNLFDDGLTAGTFTTLNLTGALTYGTATGNRTVSTSATITTGTIPNLTAGTTTSTAATITNGTITNGTIATALIPTLTAGTTTGTAGIFTSGTVTTLNSTTGTIATLNSTTGTIATLNSTTGTIPTLVATTLITTGTGTAAAPAIVPTGDTNTGIFFPAADTIAFAEGGTEGMRIDSSGNVGIGTASPRGKLDVSGDVYVAGGNQIQITGSPGTTGLQLFGQDAAESLIGTMSSQSLVLRTNATERLRIDSSGVFYVNKTSTNTVSQSIISGGTANALECETSSSASYPFLAINTATSGSNRFVYFGTEAGGSSQRGFIDYNRGSNVTRYSTTSDARLKNIIGDSSGEESISILKNTKIRDYTWKEDKSAKVNVGVIAQELHNVFKGAVSVGNQITRKDSNGNDVIDEEPWGVDKTAFTFHLISGWQSHEKIIQELKLENNSLKARLEALEAK
jgi:hypothetical protein